MSANGKELETQEFTPFPDDFTSAVNNLTNRIADLEAQQRTISQQIADFVAEIKPILEEVIPMVDKVQGSPIFRAMLGKRK